MYNLKGKTILIVSNESWGEIWYSKHNWAFELSKENRVFFINPQKKWKLSNLLSTELIEEKITNNLSSISYSNKIPLSRIDFIRQINEKIFKKLFFRYIKTKENIIFWTFDPYRFSNPAIFTPEKSIYFITDKFQTKSERTLIKNSDYIFSVSPTLSTDLKHQNTLNLTHGISKSEFVPEKEISLDNFILYIGNIDHRINYILLEELLLKFPEQKFLFIGNILPNENDGFHKLFIDKKYSNLIINGPVHFKDLKNYISKAKLCLAIMHTGVHGNNINHHKLLQYLAFGKPVLSPVFDDYSDNKDLILGYKSTKEAISKVEKLIELTEDASIIKNRINFASKHTYSSLISKIELFLSKN